MPPITSRHGALTRRIIWIIVVAMVTLCAVGFVRLGALLYEEDPLQRADAIMVLAGSKVERPLEGADLYREGYAPRIVLSADTPDGGEEFLRRKGISVPTGAELARDAIIAAGVPPAAILIPPRIHDNTAQEADTVRMLAQEHGWRRVIVVTSKYHTRRAGFAMRRALKGSGVEVIMCGSRYDPANPGRWWRQRRDIRWAGSEATKFLLYRLGLSV